MKNYQFALLMSALFIIGSYQPNADALIIAGFAWLAIAAMYVVFGRGNE
jgi:hypothetical protein